MLADQNGHCAICPTPHEETKGKRLHVDHDHKTGEVRGLLCRHCNHGLGQFKDDPDRMIRAAEYVNIFRDNFIGARRVF